MKKFNSYDELEDIEDLHPATAAAIIGIMVILGFSIMALFLYAVCKIL